ncbi:MAG: tRNA pseudouridine(38-40) synthase TruA [Chloroflexi bacterium]|nr:tRNA pseudouridine(38-40) synthase TruA [Chloroflexota bacterium]MCI0862856.1 tRNA pseudouridine(38-40) synthase TruA [Chloroflexota bacterium]
MEEGSVHNSEDESDNGTGGQLWRAALLVEYQGTRYSGFQLQAGHPTIQGELEKALARFTGQPTRIRGASRTDSGAHAKGQVVDFLTATQHPLDRFAPALNYHLPEDINVLEAHRVDDDFHSRRCALSRTYQYSILNRSAPSPLRRHTHLWIREHLDAERMAEAAQFLVGIHDFRALAAGHPQDRGAVREVMRWEVERSEDSIVIECEANGFLKQQIRKANGILTEIGRGKYPVNRVKEALAGDVSGTPLLPAHGLCLISVKYPGSVKIGPTPGDMGPENMGLEDRGPE